MSSQSVQQAYASTTQLLFNNINSKEYLQMSQESPVVSKYYFLVDNPQQYYIIIQSFDMLEFRTLVAVGSNCQINDDNSKVQESMGQNKG